MSPTRSAALVFGLSASLALLALGSAAGPRTGPPEGDASEAVARTLDALHDAASTADFDRYFSLFAPGAVFLGTDAGERWTLEEFKAYTRPYFEKGQGWTYIPRPDRRHVEVRGDVAWFDEALDNAKYGECRGTGVAVRDADRWRVAHYSLTVPIPNELLPDVAQMIRQRAKKE